MKIQYANEDMYMNIDIFQFIVGFWRSRSDDSWKWPVQWLGDVRVEHFTGEWVGFAAVRSLFCTGDLNSFQSTQFFREFWQYQCPAEVLKRFELLVPAWQVRRIGWCDHSQEPPIFWGFISHYVLMFPVYWFPLNPSMDLIWFDILIRVDEQYQ